MVLLVGYRMILLMAFVVELLMVPGVLAATQKSASFLMTNVDDVSAETYADNRILVIGGKAAEQRRHSEETAHKHKDEMFIDHNEVDPDRKRTAAANLVTTTMTPTVPTPTAEITTAANERQVLKDWLSSIPKNIFNMRNRIRLASLFLEAHSRDDVIKKLALATGSRRLRHEGRRRRKYRKRWPIPYHPNVRFVAIKGTQGRYY